MDKKKAKSKVVPSVPDEEKSANGEKEKPVIEKKPITPDTIFLADKIDKLFNAKDPIESINVLLQDHFRKINGNANFDEEKLRAEAEFHVNNLVFVKQNFPNFDNETLSSLMNILGKLIKFKNASKHINPKILPNESQASVGSIDISGNQFPPEDVSNLNNNNNKNVSPQNQNVNPQNNPNENNNNSPEKNNSQEENKEENADNCEGEKNMEQENENENENNNIEDVDFLFLSICIIIISIISSKIIILIKIFCFIPFMRKRSIS